MAQKSLGKQLPNIEGGKKYGLKYSSFITTDTTFAASGGLSGIAVKGQMRFDDSTSTYVYWNGASETTLAATSGLTGVGLDEGYDINPIITVDSDDVQLKGSTTDDILTVSSSANTASGKSLIDLVWTGTPDASGNMLRLDVSGATASGVPTLIEVVGAGKTVRGISIDTDGTSVGAALFNCGGALTNGVGVVMIANDGTLAAGGSLLNVTMGAAPSDSTAAAVEIVASQDCLALDIISAAASDSAVQITGSGNIANNKAILELIDGGVPANAGSNILRIDGSGVTATNKSVLVEIVGTGKTVRGLEVDTDIADANVVLFNGSGNLADNSAVLSVTADGGSQSAGGNVVRIANSGTPNGDSRLLELDGAGKDMTAIYVDCDSATQHGLYMRNDGNPGASKAMVYLDLNGDPNATGALLYLDAIGATATNTAYSMQINNTTTDMGAINIDAANATDSTVLINCGGALANNKALIELTWDGTPANAGTNMLRVDGSGGTNTAKPVLVEIYDDDVSVGLSVTTATIEDMVTLIGTGATGSNSSVLDVTSTATLNVGGNLVRIDGSGATTTSKPVLLEVLDDNVATAATFTSLPTANNVVTVAAGGAMTNGFAGLMVTSSGAIATGGAASAIVISGSPTNASMALEIDAQKDMRGLFIDCDAATNSAVEITGAGVVAADKAMLLVTNTGTMANGSALLRLDSGAAATATAYALEINASHANTEGIWVNSGTVLIDESLEVTAGLTSTAIITAPAGIQGILGTTADLTGTPTDAELSTAFGVGNKTKGGFIGVVEDSGSNVTHIVVSDGTTWHFVSCTAAGA